MQTTPLPLAAPQTDSLDASNMTEVGSVFIMYMKKEHNMQVCKERQRGQLTSDKVTKGGFSKIIFFNSKVKIICILDFSSVVSLLNYCNMVHFPPNCHKI